MSLGFKGAPIGLLFLFQLVTGGVFNVQQQSRQPGFFEGFLPFQLEGVATTADIPPGPGLFFLSKFLHQMLIILDGLDRQTLFPGQRIGLADGAGPALVAPFPKAVLAFRLLGAIRQEQQVAAGKDLFQGAMKGG